MRRDFYTTFVESGEKRQSSGKKIKMVLEKDVGSIIVVPVIYVTKRKCCSIN